MKLCNATVLLYRNKLHNITYNTSKMKLAKNLYRTQYSQFFSSWRFPIKFLFMNNSIYLLNFILVIIKKLPPEVFCKNGVLRIFAKFTEKHLCQSFFLMKFEALNFTKFLRTTFLQNSSWRLLLINMALSVELY